MMLFSDSAAAPVAAEAQPQRPRSRSHSPSHSHKHAEGEEEEGEIFFEIPEFDVLASALRDESAPISKRMRSVFLLKQLGDEPSIKVLAEGLRSSSVLLAHECGYVLGQLQNPLALPMLESGLADRSLSPIVRHECAEAIGAIGREQSLALLEKYVDDEAIEVAETAQIAIERIKWNAQTSFKVFPSKYASVDPAPRTEDGLERSVEELQTLMMDTTKNLFERYRAMFALRDKGTEEAVLALATGFNDKSAVFRHEVAYVMGQIQHPAAIQSLKKMLSNGSEHAMVRHEAAEALGSIASEDLTPYLQTYQKNDKDTIVRESCDVALDLVDYWNNDEVCTAVDPNQ